MRQYQQIPTRTRYFIATLSQSPIVGDPNFTDSLAAMIYIPQGVLGLTQPTQILDGPITDLGTNVAAVQFDEGLVLKDLGRQLFVYNPLGPDAILQCIYRQAEKQKNPLAEGTVPYNSMLPASQQNVVWIKVWQASDTDQKIFFARIG